MVLMAITEIFGTEHIACLAGAWLSSSQSPGPGGQVSSEKGKLDGLGGLARLAEDCPRGRAGSG